MKNEYENWSKEDLIKEVRLLKRRKRYGLVWEDKPEDIATKCHDEIPILDEINKYEVVNDLSSLPNIFIEGENYHALSVLNYTHKESVDLIYIDPPYNTESEDFVYNDKIVDKEDSYRHSKWLSFMSKRLLLAKNILKRSGAIAISINENELFQLKLLCDDIFGETNYLTTITVKVRHEDRILKGDKDFHEVVEYLLLYRKNSAFKQKKREKDNTSLDEYVYLIKEKIKTPTVQKIGNKNVEIFKPDEYELIKVLPSDKAFKKISIRGSIKEGNSSGRFYMKYLEALADKMPGYLFKVPDMGADEVPYRYFITAQGKRVNGDYLQGVPLNRKDIIGMPYSNFIDFEEDFNSVGYEGGIEFRNGKKPLSFLQRIFEITGIKERKDAIILDFFAGSGTTGHAVLLLNRSVPGKRRFILCTNNENKIAEEICYPRIVKAIKGYKGKKGIEEPLGGNLKYYKTSLISASKTDHNRVLLTRKATKMLCLKENTFTLVEESSDICIYKNSEKYLALLLDIEHLDKFKNTIRKLDMPTNVYVFSLGNDLYEEEFEEFGDKVTVSPIPEAIYKVYKRIFQ